MKNTIAAVCAGLLSAFALPGFAQDVVAGIYNGKLHAAHGGAGDANLEIQIEPNNQVTGTLRLKRLHETCAVEGTIYRNKLNLQLTREHSHRCTEGPLLLSIERGRLVGTALGMPITLQK